MLRGLYIGIFMMCRMVLPDQDIYYYGVNSEPVNGPGDALAMKEVRPRAGSGFVIITRHLNHGEWRRTGRARLKFTEEGRITIRESDQQGLFPDRYTREYRPVEITETTTGKYHFRDIRDGKVQREGFASSLVPLHLEGEITTWYGNDRVKSVSVYENNQLQSNRNWLPDGSRYVDTLFYSADRVPEFEYGVEFFNSYIMQRLHASGFDLSLVEDRIVIGWVIMENGSLEAPVALEGNNRQLRELLVEIMAGLPGTWKPAVLDGKRVRYFMTLPLNFYHQDVSFQNLEMSGSILHYDSF